MTEVLVTIARNEEIIKNMREQQIRQEGEVKEIKGEIDELKEDVASNKRTIKILNGLAWVATTGVIAAVIRFFTTAGLT